MVFVFFQVVPLVRAWSLRFGVSLLFFMCPFLPSFCTCYACDQEKITEQEEKHQGMQSR